MASEIRGSDNFDSATVGMPVGTVIDFAGTAPPTGFLTCPIRGFIHGYWHNMGCR